MIPYFREYGFNKIKLLITSAIGNTLVFGILTYMLFYGTGVVQKYLDLIRITLQNQGFNF
jgi:hypothetical protein